MIRLILFLLVAYLILQVFRSVFGQNALRRGGGGLRPPGETDELMVKDLQCETYIPRAEAILAERDGITYYFCSRECRDAFMAKL